MWGQALFRHRASSYHHTQAITIWVRNYRITLKNALYATFNFDSLDLLSLKLFPLRKNVRMKLYSQLRPDSRSRSEAKSTEPLKTLLASPQVLLLHNQPQRHSTNNCLQVLKVNLIETLNNINSKLDSLEETVAGLHRLGHTPCNAASSCAEILQEDSSVSSGYYWVRNATGHPHSVYCNMNMSCKGVSGGWMRVAYLDMTNTSHHCPTSLRQRTDSAVRSCAAYSDSPTCSSVQHRTHGILYSIVCGKITAYQDDTTNGFLSTVETINSFYVDGISLTLGQPLQHIWTFAADFSCCPCTDAPSFVGNNYFCDSAQSNSGPINLANPIWDGEDCVFNSCCRQNNPPWFRKQLPQPTTDNIQMRLCRDQARDNEDVAIKKSTKYMSSN